MLYVVRAYEQSYGALHGIDTIFVMDEDDLSVVEDEAAVASRDVMESYSFIVEALQQQACFYCGVDEYDEDECEELAEAYSDAVEENVAYSIWEVNSDCEYSMKEIDQMLGDDPDGFVEEYCTAVVGC